GEAALEIEREGEAAEQPGEHRRLAEHEDELKRRVAGREVKAGHRAEGREPAGEAREEDEREDQRRDEQAGAAQVGMRAAAPDRQRDLRQAAEAGRFAHVRSSLPRSVAATPSRAMTDRPMATAKPRHSAVRSQPSM